MICQNNKNLRGKGHNPQRGIAQSARRLTAFLLSVFAAAALLLTSCSTNIKPQTPPKEDLRPVGNVSGREVYFDELRYVAVNCREELSAKYGEDIWDDPAKAEEHRAELEEMVTRGLASSYYAVLKLADDYYLGGADAMLSEKAIVDAVAEEVNKTAEECGGKKQYLKTLEENGLTDRLFRFYLSIEEMATELTYILKTDLGVIPSSVSELEEYMHSDKFIRTNHIYIKGLEEDRLELAKELREQLLKSDTPDLELVLLKGRYDSDFSITTTHGTYFARYSSDYGDDYEKAAFALEVGGISDIVKGNAGYFVIMRLPVEDDWLNYNFEDFGNAIIGSEFNSMVEEYKSTLVFEFNELGKETDLVTLE